MECSHRGFEERETDRYSCCLIAVEGGAMQIKGEFLDKYRKDRLNLQFKYKLHTLCLLFSSKPSYSEYLSMSAQD